MIKNTTRFLASVLFVLFLTGCPEEQGQDLDTPLNIRNSTSDSVTIRPYLNYNVDISDTVFSMEQKEFIYLFVEDPTGSLFLLAGNETKKWTNVSYERISTNPDGMYVHLVNPDTLLNYTAETWDGVTGVKRYFFYDLEDYEEIDFTMEYP